MLITTLCYFVDETNRRILLAQKKRSFGKGKLNGPGIHNRFRERSDDRK